MMTAWFRRSRQTRTPVHSPPAAQLSREQGTRAAYRTLFVIQMAAQLLLWVSLYGYENAMQTTWQAVLMLLLPLLALWALWRVGGSAVSTPMGARIALLLLPCLMLDAALLLYTTQSLLRQIIPSYSPTLDALLIAIFCFLTVCLGKQNGVAFGANCLWGLLLLLFLFSTLLLDADANPVRLWPLLGQGLQHTAMQALSGVGSLWGIALLFILPLGKPTEIRSPMHPRMRTLLWALIPLGLGFIWALTYSMVRPWRVGDVMTDGQRLLLLGQQSNRVFLSQFPFLLLLLLPPIALSGCVMSGEKLLRNAAPKCPRSVAAALLLLPAVVLVLAFPAGPLAFLQALLPFRTALSALTGGLMLIIAKK
ncbi:MAG: hypothetical protein RR653_02765 [Clostridia bacterium]